MIVKKSKKIARHARHNRVRAVVEGTSARPRLAVYRSNKHISAQIIDDEKQITLVSASTFLSVAIISNAIVRSASPAKMAKASPKTL